MISPVSIQQIIDKLDIMDVVGEFVTLKKRGANYLGLCPFHGEKTPSFTVSPAKEIYKCFGCGRSGNTISFIMEHEKYGYIEAMKWLATRYGIEIEETFSSDEQRQQFQVSDSLYIINQFAQQFFTTQLFESEEGRNIGLSYFKNRGFREEIIQKFQLGYSPEKIDSFSQEAIDKKYDKELLQKAGLVVFKNFQYQDNYRGRVIFPIHNQSGKVLGFGARILKSDAKAPKYINTPETEIYVKSKILYGSYFARQAIGKADECLLVEGYTDVISLHQAGIENVVASGGTSLTEDQLRLIKKFTPNLTILYDGDAAGVKAAQRGLELALENALNVRLVLLPENEDPDSFLHNVGAEEFKKYIDENKKDFIFFQLDIAIKEAGNDLIKKSDAVNKIAETLSKINKVEDFAKQQEYIKKAAELLKVEEDGLRNLVNKHLLNKIEALDKKATKAKTDAESSPIENENSFTDESFHLLFNESVYEKELARILIEYGDKPWNEEKLTARYILDEIPEEGLFENHTVIKIVHIYKEAILQNKMPEKNFFIYHNDNELSTMAVSLLNFPYEQSERWSSEFGQLAGYQPMLFEQKHDEFKRLMNETNVADLKKYLHTQKDTSLDQVTSALCFLKLRKIKLLISQNLLDIEKTDNEDNLILLIKTHTHLKEVEKELTEKIGTVIMK